MGGEAMIKGFLRDKKGVSMVVYALGIMVAALMFLWYQTAFSQLLIERTKLLKIADEAVLKASWEIYEYQASTLHRTGTIDTQALSRGITKVADYFTANGYTARNITLSVDKGYLILRANVDLRYKKPSLLNPAAQFETISIPVESKATLRKLK
jgi:Flp pilus assembly protein TadG